jgi:hypothetical protein
VKYKIDDIVKIKDKKIIEMMKDERGNIYCDGIWFIEEMFEYTGRYTNIKSIEDGSYRLNIDDGEFAWNDLMLE